MAKRFSRLAVGLTAIVVLTLLPAADAAASQLSGLVGGGATFPERSLVLSAPPGVKVTVPRIYVSENGKPVDHLSVTPVNQANAGDFGVVLVIDQSASMRGAPLAHAMAAARAIAANRTGKQELGVTAFAAHPTVILPLTSNPKTIAGVVSGTPWTATGTRILPALASALQQLANAHIADGAVILLSDGAGNGPTLGLSPQSIGATAREQHVRIFTVGLQDRSSKFSLMRQLAQLGGGSFTPATSAQLPHIFTGITGALAHSYLLRYQSILPANERVAVKVHVDGVSSQLSLSYFAGTPPVVRPVSAPQPRPARHAAAPSHQPAATPQKIVPVPGFASQVPSYTPRTPPPSFWNSSLAVPIVAGVCALLIGLAVAILFYRPSRLDLRRRINAFTAGSGAEIAAAIQLDSGRERLASRLTNTRWWLTFTEQAQTARMQRTPVALYKRAVGASLLVAVVLVEVTGSTIFGVLAILASPFALRAWVGRTAKKQRRVFAEQLPTNLQDLAGAMRAGRSFVGAISAVAETAAEPMRGELDRALTDERLGLPLEDAFEAIGRRMGAKDMDQVSLVAALSRQSGSNIAEALERVAQGSRERADLAREMRALTGQARLSSWVLSGMPAVLLLALTFLAPQYAHPLFHTTGGIVVLVFATCMVMAGWFVMQKIVNPE